MARVSYDSAPLEGLGITPQFYVKRIDAHSWGITPEPAPTPPVVSNVDPAVGEQLERGTPLSFDVTDDSGAFRRILIAAAFAGLATHELAHDGDAFAPLYAAGSSRVAITGGYRYTLLRAGGWPAAPTITPYAIDSRGAENA